MAKDWYSSSKDIIDGYVSSPGIYTCYFEKADRKLTKENKNQLLLSFVTNIKNRLNIYFSMEELNVEKMERLINQLTEVFSKFPTYNEEIFKLIINQFANEYFTESPTAIATSVNLLVEGLNKSFSSQLSSLMKFKVTENVWNGNVSCKVDFFKKPYCAKIDEPLAITDSEINAKPKTTSTTEKKEESNNANASTEIPVQTIEKQLENMKAEQDSDDLPF